MSDTPDLNEIYSDPKVVTLVQQLQIATENLDNLVPLPYPGFIAQEEYRNVELPILATDEEVKEMLEHKGLTNEDHQKYFDIVKRIHEENRLDLEMKDASLENILKFCTAAMWLITGNHNEDRANAILMGNSTSIKASTLADLDIPPITKCTFFNSAFVYLFEAACTYFRREDILTKYQLIVVRTTTHWYLALVSMYKGKYQISAIDPYHTSWKEKIDEDGINPNTLFEKLDRTNERAAELVPAYWNAVNWRKEE